MASNYEVAIIGGGFYGLRIAQFLREELGFTKIVVLEYEPEVMSKASYNNQARVHGGYHYPRNILTALRSKANLPRFVQEYEQVIDDDFINYYAVAKHFSKVSSRQFFEVFRKIEAPIERDAEAMKFFNKTMIEGVYRVREYAFNSTQLKQLLLKKMHTLNVDIMSSQKAQKVESYHGKLHVTTDKIVVTADHVINSTYSGINRINRGSHLPLIPLKYELAEMCLVQVPPALQSKSFTIMCGPFFSLMPFPSQAPLYTLSHVNHTPHVTWQDNESENEDGEVRFNTLSNLRSHSHFQKMFADIKRYMPEAANITYTGKSLWEVKTVLRQNEADDGRPILFSPNHGNLKNYTCIMGGKIDNIYDVFEELGAVI